MNILSPISIIVTGDRDYHDYRYFGNKLDRFHIWISQNFNETLWRVHHGGSRGVDALAQRYCENNAIACHTHHPDWDMHGKAAGIKRNIRMLKIASPKYVLEFSNCKKPSHIMDISRKYGVKTFGINIPEEAVIPL